MPIASTSARENVFSETTLSGASSHTTFTVRESCGRATGSGFSSAAVLTHTLPVTVAPPIPAVDVALTQTFASSAGR